MNEIPFNSLAWSAWLRVYWGFVWRGLAITLASMVVGGLAGGIVGFFFGLISAVTDVELNQAHVQVIGGAIGFGVGLYFYAIYIRWLFASKFGNLRLTLTSDDEPAKGMADAQQIAGADD